MIRISTLGALTVSLDGEVRPMTAPRQRSVLAHLALEPGVPQSAERLLDAIWGDDQPAGGAKAVAFQITKLRDALEPDRSGEGTVIRTTSAGYVLDVDPGQIDLHRVHSLIDDAATALADDPAKAGALAEEALDLWAGPPFADIADSPVLDEERRRFDLLRTRAATILHDAQLALGQHDAALPGLARLAEQHPLDEHVIGLYMRALDRCGRAADALRAASALRTRLVDELGIDPSDEIARLELALINRERPTAEQPSSPTPSVPAIGLPRPATTLIGRTDQAEAIAQQLARPDVQVVTLLGPGGVGKTRLAIEAASRWQADHGHRVAYCPLAGLHADAGLVDAVAEAVGFLIDQHIVVAGGLDERTQLLDYLTLEPGLLVIDNAEHLAAVAPLVADIAEHCPDLVVLVTSRERLAIAAEWITQVDGLDTSTSTSDAPTLFMTRARQAGADPAALDPAAVLRLCRAAAGLPLAIELAAALAPAVATAELADRLEHDADSIQIETLDVEPRHRSLLSAFDHSWQLADPPLRVALARLAAMPAPFDSTAAEAVAAAGPSTVARLVLKSLVQRVDSRTFALHPLMRQFALDRLGDDEHDTKQAHSRHYLDRLLARTDDLFGSPDQMAAADAIDTDFEHIRAAAVWAASQVDDPATDRRLAESTHAISAYGFIRSIATWAEILRHVAETIESLLGDRATDSDAYLWARVYQCYPDAMREADGVDDLMATLEPHLVRLGDRALAWCLVNRAICRELAGDVAAALTLMERSNEAMRRVDDPDPLLHAAVTSWHGWELSLLGRNDEAQTIWKLGLDHSTAAHNLTARAYALSKVGLGADDVGDHELALRCHQESAELFARTSDNGGLGYTLSRLSWTHRMLGNLDEATAAASDALECFQRVNHRWGIGASLGRRAHAELDGGHLADAATDFSSCIAWGEAKQMPSIVLYGLVGIGLCLARDGQTERAVELFAHNALVPQNPYAPAFAVPGLAAAEERLPSDEFERARKRGEALDLEAAKALARGYARELGADMPAGATV